MSNTPDSSRPENLSLDRNSLRVEIVIDRHVTAPMCDDRVQQAVSCAAAHLGYTCGEIGVRVTDDRGIHQINRQHLGHDFPTDVISFVYLAEKPVIEGELVVSADTARRCALQLGWSACDEFTLYVVHGTLHIAGLDDQDSRGRTQMRQAERAVMMQLGINDIVRFGADRAAAAVPDSNTRETRS